ncbi:Protein phosphatase 1A [Geodia barretti]|uniref:Protein phosphatase 1A n=1 Tax=Geodia barretti TaxID=519541 RepID=A0AA35XAW5_GEOBA|nr:Protein phosphatase 1A [Geodia barretti]
MGAFLEKPKTEKTVSQGEANSLRWGVSAMQGWRLEMEDAHTCETNLKLKGWSFFAVFDGHAGPKVSQYCSTNLLRHIMGLVKSSDKEEDVSKKMKRSFLEIDDMLKKENQDERPSGGTTAVACMVSPDKFIWANCGDSRGLLCRANKLEYATLDHKPMNEQERLRIEKAGGTVMMQRVNGSLAVSRALGDFDYKRSSELKQSEQLVSPEPDMYVLDRSKDDQFLLLACDGVYDVMTNDEIVAYILHHLQLESKLSKICSDLIDTCLNKNSRDNMSVILITFPSAPKVSPTAIEKEKQLKEELHRRICDILERVSKEAHDPMDMEENYLLQQLNTELSLQYPEIYSEREFISRKIHEKKVEKFGKDANNFAGSDVSFEQVPEPLGFGDGQGDTYTVSSLFLLLNLSLSPFLSPFSDECICTSASVILQTENRV